MTPPAPRELSQKRQKNTISSKGNTFSKRSTDTLKLFKVWDGWNGCTGRQCLVLADNETAAINAAKPAFIAKGDASAGVDTYLAIELCKDVGRPWVGPLEMGKLNR